ncbi:GTP 3',8-cyclase MoaA [Desnuesiella massiliensis]|uniref:GTP 3',8-cyclase MoaA n=1 Tax=Desnuesiella massiliensis TaxID=1650662 RepID=UPI0006E38C50|nr:GTP 3',8-cyclase MoaA [Desnuesiella massiliensis]
MIDRWGRNIDYLRVSVTDRCNLRCKYCIPEQGIKYSSKDELMTLEEIYKAVKLFSELGISKVRVTGGEPLVREGITTLIKDINKLPKIKEVYMTTNGTLLSENIENLVDAGIKGLNISLDSLKKHKYDYITRGNDFDKVMDSITKSIESGIKVKINTVIMKGFNEDEILDFASFSEKYPVDVRFIELMPIGESRDFQAVSSDSIKNTILESKELFQCKNKNNGEGPAEYFSVENGIGRIGFISAMSHSFCSSCNRVRLTSQGFVKQCLHWKHGISLRDLIRSENDDESIKEALRNCIYSKPLEHNFNKISEDGDKRYMSQIGG